MAAEDYIDPAYEECGFGEPSFVQDPLYYFTAVKRTRVQTKHETPRAKLLTIDGIDVWMPKKLLRENKAGHYIYIHTAIGMKMLATNRENELLRHSNSYVRTL